MIFGDFSPFHQFFTKTNFFKPLNSEKQKSLYCLNISSKFDTYKKIRYTIVQQYGGNTKFKKKCLFCFSLLK